jgi:hypothetical protein
MTPDLPFSQGSADRRLAGAMSNKAWAKPRLQKWRGFKCGERRNYTAPAKSAAGKSALR